MSTVVKAEFDSFDMADIASWKIRRFDGVNDIKITKSRFSKKNDDDDDELRAPALPPLGTGYSQMGVYSPFNVYPGFFSSINDGIEDTEYGERKEVFMTVFTDSSSCAQKVSSYLTSAGGRQVKILEDSTK